MAQSFSAQMKVFENLTADKAEKVFRRTCLDLSSDIIKGTPVDSGRARMNWQPEINKFDGTSSIELDTTKTALRARNKVKDKVASLKIGSTFTLTNNLDYIEDLEFGGYPNPPKFGTRTDKAKGSNNPIKFEIRSVGGYSAQAPQGMARINLLRFNQILQIANMEIK